MVPWQTSNPDVSPVQRVVGTGMEFVNATDGLRVGARRVVASVRLIVLRGYYLLCFIAWAILFYGYTQAQVPSVGFSYFEDSAAAVIVGLLKYVLGRCGVYILQ